MDQPLPRPDAEPVSTGSDRDAGAAKMAEIVADFMDDPRAWFTRGLIEADGLDAPAGSALAMEIEVVTDQVLTADPASGGRLSRHDAVAFIQAVTRQMSRLEAMRSLAMTMLTHDAAYHECDTGWSEDDGTGRACPACTTSTGGEQASAGKSQGRSGSQNASPVGQVGMEMSAALGVSPMFATGMVDRAVDQVRDLPDTWVKMAEGSIDGYKARLIAAGTRPLIENFDASLPEAELATERARRERLRASIERRVLPTAAAKTGEQLRRQIRRLVLRADPDTARAARTIGTADRQVSQPYTRDDGPAVIAGIGSMTLRGPVEDLQALYRALDAAARHARTEEGDPRTLDQLRFDIITGTGWSALRSGQFGCGDSHNHEGNHHEGDAGGGLRMAATVGRRPVEVRVTVSLATLLGLDEDPADLDGVGPIPADVALDLAFGEDATWRRLITDPLTGALLDYGHRTYRPPAAVDSYVRTRDGTCRFPTTLADASHADLDHTTPFDHTDVHSCPGHSCRRPGGSTAPDNLGVLSRRAHISRTRHHWQLEQPEAGTFRWTSPAGHTYTVDPDLIAEPESISTLMTDDVPPF